MKLWKIVQYEHTGYETFDEAVVAANTEEDARKIHPKGDEIDGWPEKTEDYSWASTWTKVHATYLGKADENIIEGIVVASYMNP